MSKRDNNLLLVAILFFIGISSTLKAQTPTKWYSETTANGITIQNSYPKGGPYKGSVKQHYNYSYLVFFSRVINNTNKPLELNLSFTADAIAIPNSPDTFVKLFLPSEVMTMDKQRLFSYGITELKSLEKATGFNKTIPPKKDALFYIVAVFYQTKPNITQQDRGGNRSELLLKGNKLYYNMLPQIEMLPCGSINFKK